MNKIEDSINIGQFDQNDYKIEKKENCYTGFFRVDKYFIKHRLFAGGWSGEFTREIFERGDAVVLIPYDPTLDQLVLNQQFRAGAVRSQQNPWLLEFVAGMFGENESAAEVAIREAKEEANLDISPLMIKPVMKFLSSPGGTSECLHLYVGKVDSRYAGGIHGLKEENEDIKTMVVSREKAIELIDNGTITNASTIIGIQWLALNYKSLKNEWR